jgi:hypothetical protein
MKKVIIAITLCLFTSMAISSCTEENITPKKDDAGTSSGGGSDGGRP